MLFIATLIAAATALATPQSSARDQGTVATDVARAIQETSERFERALAERDAAALDALVATPFSWIHGADGRVEGRTEWLAAAARGMALTGQRSVRTEYGVSLTAYGAPQAHTVIRIARVQLVDATAKRESWLRQAQVFVRVGDGSWRIASGQGSLMYDGPRLDPTLHSKYVGTFGLPDGRTLVLKWEDGGLFATLPSGAHAQIFLGSPTEESVRAPGVGRLRFILDANGRPTAAALVRGDAEVWRATRREK